MITLYLIASSYLSSHPSLWNASYLYLTMITLLNRVPLQQDSFWFKASQDLFGNFTFISEKANVKVYGALSFFFLILFYTKPNFQLPVNQRVFMQNRKLNTNKRKISFRLVLIFLAIWGSVRGLIELKFWQHILGTRIFNIDCRDFIWSYLQSDSSGWLFLIYCEIFLICLHCCCRLLPRLLILRYLLCML